MRNVITVFLFPLYVKPNFSIAHGKQHTIPSGDKNAPDLFGNIKT